MGEDINFFFLKKVIFDVCYSPLFSFFSLFLLCMAVDVSLGRARQAGGQKEKYFIKFFPFLTFFLFGKEIPSKKAVATNPQNQLQLQ
jgi:hypothetical protein